MIALTTPTGQIGRQTLENLLAAGEEVRVLVRDPGRLPAETRERVAVVTGSMDDADAVVAAFAGAEAAFWVVPPNPRAESVAGHILGFAGALCAAIERSGVERVVAVSSLGRGVARHAGQISAIIALDHLVESTGVAYRALCPPGFMENMLHQAGSLAATGTFYSLPPVDLPLPTCATRDIAAVAAEVLRDRTWEGQASVPLPGPERLSGEDMAAILSAVLGRPIDVQRVAPEAYKATLVEHGMTDAWAQGLLDMASAAERGIYDGAPADPRHPTPTTFREWSEAVLRPAVLAAAPV
ncbi:MAG TPA: NAD(P)H-binding protein [Solirubrobacterales bacterium]|nr:NAD(P)H-binding protein [Solirubrobacterales bacterium]